MRTNYRLKKLIFIASLAAISVVFGVIEITLGLPWLKLDVSELAILVAAVVIGYKGAFGLVIIRGLFRQAFQGQLFMPTELVGEAIAVIASSVILLTYYGLSKALKTYRKPLIFEAVVDPKSITAKEILVIVGGLTVSLTVIMITLNIFVLTPIYLSTYDALFQFFGFEAFHFTAFTLLNDPGMSNVFGADLSSWNLYVTYIVVNYTLLNVAKGFITSMLFLPIKSTLEKVEL
jgi:riboflavin transporter FmnP